MGNDIQRGYDFSGTSPNNTVTAEKLNSLADEARIKETFLTSKAEITEAASGDYLLLLKASDGVYRKATVGNLITAARGRPGATELQILYVSATSFQVTATHVLMRNVSNGNLYLATTFNATVDISSGVGVNGLDAGTEAASTWYYIWAISDGVNDRLLLSTSASSPTLPSGYIYSCLLGPVYNNASSNFTVSYQHENDIQIDYLSDATTTNAENPHVGVNEFTSYAPTSADTWEVVNLSKRIPPNIVTRVQGIIGVVTNNVVRRVALCGHKAGSALASLTTGLKVFHLVAPTPVVGSATTNGTAYLGFYATGNFDVPVIDSQAIYWASNSNTGTPHSMRITGYSISLH